MIYKTHVFKFFLFCLLACLAIPASAQKTKAKKGPKTGGSFFSKLDRKYAKYFATIGAGIGGSRWNSTLGDTYIYDDNGAIIKSGDLRFKTRGKYDTYFLEVSMPVGNFRLGLGVNFEYNYIDKLQILDPRGDYYILYSESFRYEKIYLSYEIPFNARTDNPWSFGVKGNIGRFWVSYVDHFNFFGEEPLARQWLFSGGLLGDIKPYPHTYIFLYPHLEYVYFNNAKSENPAEVIHKVFHYAITAGVRIDVSKE